MITNLSLKNIRLFSDKTWDIPLPRLAIFCGTNSAGKSTLFKTLLLIRQSQGIQESQNTQKGKLRFAGNQVDVGDYSSFVSHNDPTREMEIGITVSAIAPGQWVNFLKSINSTEEDRNQSPEIKSEIEVPYSFEAKFTFCGRSPKTDQIKCRIAGMLKSASYTMTSDAFSPFSWRVEKKQDSDSKSEGDYSYDILIREKYFERVGGKRLMQVDESDPSGELKLTTILRGLLPDAIVAKIRPDKKNKEQDMWGNWPMPPQIDSALGEFRTALTQLHYIGPLRSPAKRFYLTHLDSSPNIDPSGESLPSLLRERSSDQIWDCGYRSQDKPREVSLAAALNSWIKYFRTGEYFPSNDESTEVELTVTSDVLVEIKIKSITGTESHALTDSGFGFSQVIPILVRGLLSDKNSTLLVEQPELHLNPALHVRLASFFSAMIRAGKQVIIETHSEHIVNAIRVLCAEDDTDYLNNNSKIFYLSASNGTPNIHELSIRSDGMVPDWPKEFFGEAADLSGRLLRAQRKHIKKA